MGSDQRQLRSLWQPSRGAVSFLAAILLAGCGGQPPDGSARPTPPASPTITPTETSPTPAPEPPVVCSDETAAGPEVRLRVVDNAFRPACLIVLGGQFIRLTSFGSNVHNFSVEGTDLDVDIDAASRLTTEAIGQVVEPGEHRFFCKYHEDLGMEGELRVTAAG